MNEISSQRFSPLLYIVVNVYAYTGPDLAKKLDEAGISAAKRPGGAGGEAGENLDGAKPHLDEAGVWRAERAEKFFRPI